MRTPSGRAALTALVLLLALCCQALGQDAVADETALAERYAPVVRLVEQLEECGPGEPYAPIDVDVLFDEPTVALRGAWGGGDLITVAPSTADLAPGRYEYHLDFPGHALDPGCGYERWGRRVTEGHPPTVYAHVATDPGHPGKLALQYWFFYVFNDWNNTHEGDWEMIQIVFDAYDAGEALSGEPVEVGYSQHTGGERAVWGDDKLELVDGTHPVVHPARGSHANYFGESLYIGRSAEEGVGCDDTSGPTVDMRPAVRTIPSDPDLARLRHPWLAYEGRWGELQQSIFNGPTGPPLKRQWTEPIAWSEGWRDRSLAFAGGGAFGTGATDFFCGAVAGGSEALRRLLDQPLPLVAGLMVIAALLVWGISRATWRPTAPLRVARRRGWGQIIAASARMYGRRLPLFLGIGLLLLPLTVAIGLLQGLVLRASGVLGVHTGDDQGGLLSFPVIALGTVLTLLGFALVQAATTRALVETDAGRPTGPVRAYRDAVEGIVPLAGALAVAVVVVSLLGASVLLVPVAVWLAVRWALIAPTIEVEGLPPGAALRRSSRLVRGDWLKVATLTLAGAALAFVTGPLAGALLIALSNAPVATANVVAGVIYAVAMPFVALTTAYTYFDIRAREEFTDDDADDDLPAEFTIEGVTPAPQE